MDLDAYRHSAETFLTELTAEHYRHYAGLQDTFELEPIYERHRDLFKRESIEALRDHDARASANDDQRRQARMLLDFAVEGYVGEATKAVEEELASTEAALTIDVAGERVGFREAPVLQANEPDSGRRAEIEAGLLAATEEQLGPFHRELIERQHASATELGWTSYVDMCEHCKGIDLKSLSEQAAAFTRNSDDGYPRVLEPELRRTLGIGMSELRRSDLPRFFRAAEQDRYFPAERLTQSFLDTMRGLGIDVSTQAGVTFDIGPRPNKSPRAFCSPVRVPDEVYLVVAPVGGRDDYAVLFHEGGHTEHFANVDRALPFEFRYLGDNSVTETYAFLMQHLVENPEWLARHLNIDDASELAAHARAYRLVYLRRYTGKIAYELELHGSESGGGWDALAGRYAELLGAALGIEWPRENFVSDVDPGFYSACYLRAWALETHLRSYLSERFGPSWFDTPEAGEVLRGLWRDGQRLDAEELLGELTGERLDFGVVLEDLGLS